MCHLLVHFSSKNLSFWHIRLVSVAISMVSVESGYMIFLNRI